MLSMTNVRNKTYLVLLSFCLSTVAGADEKAKPAADEKGFVSIFDGKSLKGWEELPSTDKKAWSVKDGIIVGEGDKGRGYLVYDATRSLLG